MGVRLGFSEIVTRCQQTENAVSGFVGSPLRLPQRHTSPRLDPVVTRSCFLPIASQDLFCSFGFGRMPRGLMPENGDF